MSNDNMFSEGTVLPEDYVSPPLSSGKRKSGRRSWFTPNKQIRLEIAVDPREQKQARHVEEDEDVEVLTLTHFTKPPKIDFGTVRVGKTCTRKLCANNPHDYIQQVVVEKFPFDKDFTIDLTEFFVEPGESQIIELTWSPKEECSQRQMILFKVEGVVRLQAFLIGKADVPVKPKKRKTWKAPKAAPLVTLQPSASIRAKQLQSSRKIEESNRVQPSFSRNPVQTRDLRKSKKQLSRKSVMENKENTPPPSRYGRDIHSNFSDEETEEMNVSTLQRSLTYSKLNQSFSPSPKRPFGSHPNSRRGSEDTRRTSKESIFSVYEDCVQSRRPSHESVVSVYEDCPTGDSRPPSMEGPMTLDDLAPNTNRKSEENTNRRLSKESLVSVYEDASEYLESPDSNEYDDSLVMPPDETKSTIQNDTPSKGFSRDIFVESYEVVEQIEEELIIEEIKVTQTKVMSDSYEISNDVNVEVTRDTAVRHHEHVVKETYVHVDGSPQRYFPGIASGEKRFFPPIDKEDGVFVAKYAEDDVLDIRRETVVITKAGRCIPEIHAEDEVDIRRETVVLSQATCNTLNGTKPVIYTQSPTRLLPPDHIAADKSFSPIQSKFSPKSPQSDPNADPNESRRDTVTMECPSPALVACHSRLVKAGHVGCVDKIETSTPLRIVDLLDSPKSSTPIPGKSGRKIGMRRNVFGPKWVQDHLQEPPCSPVTRLADEENLLSPRKSLFNAKSEPGRFSTDTVVKTKPAMCELSPDGQRNENSPVINASTVTKSRSSVGQYMSSDPAPKQFERTIDQSTFSNCGDTSEVNPRRLSSLTVTKSIPSNSVHDTIPECTEAADGGLDLQQLQDESANSLENASFSKSINSRTRSGSKKKRRSSGKHGRRSSQARVVRSETVTKPRSSFTPPVIEGPPRKRFSSKKLFSPPQKNVMDESIKPLSPSPQKRLSASGEAKLVARMKQDLESSLEFPVYHSKVTANLVQNKERRSIDTNNVKKLPTQNAFRRSVDPACLARDNIKPPKRRSFGNKTLSTNVNRPPTKPPSKPAVFDGTSTLKLTRTQTLRRNAAKSAMKADPKASSMHSTTVADTSNKPRNRYQSGPVLNKSSANRSHIASGAAGLAKSKLTLIRSKPASSTALPKHPMPFAAKNVYYDERWMEKQERGFVKWLNFVLTPPDEYVEAKKPQKVKDTISRLVVDASKLCLDAQSNPKLAPTKEVISFRTYAASRRLNRLRRSACKMFQTEQNAKLIKKLEIEIETRRLAVRQDRKIHADLGIKQKMLDMMLCYNPLWLRIGLEVIFGEVLPIESNVDIIGMSRFILTRLLDNPDIAQAYAHPTVPHLYTPGYDEAIAQHILKKFLLLVHFLDQAKTVRLIDHDPCLFCKDAEFKSSRNLLLVFARDYLRGEGDLTRHLSYMGYIVQHSQTALEEFDYAVACLASDLRDGVRLTRVIELLSKTYCLTSRMRVPAISRLQKIHNMEVALKVLTQRGLDLSTTRGGSITARDVVDGHREKTLLLLWNIIFNFQVECLIDKDQLKEEVDFLRKNLQLQKHYQALLDDLDKSTSMLGLPRDRRESVEPDVYFKSPMLSLLLKWCQAVCSYYGMKVENFTVSFSDGRALCYLVHHYHPSLLRVEDVSTETTLIYNEKHNKFPDTPGSGSDDSFSYNWTTTFSPSMGKPGVFEQLLANEKQNFKLLFDKVSELGGIPVMVRYADMSNTIPDEKVVITYVTYLCARLLDIRQETRAARIIQAYWRNFRNRKTTVAVKEHREEVERQKHSRAATKIQAWWRARGYRQQFLAKRQACVKIQQYWRTRKICQDQQAVYKQLIRSTTIIQRHFRKLLLQKRIKKQKAVITILKCWRVYKARKQMKKTMNGIVKTQAYVRGYLSRKAYLQKRSAAIKIQRSFRSFQLRKLDQEAFETKQQAVTVIQKYLRCYSQRVKYLKARSAAVKIQSAWRAYSAQTEFTKMRYAATLIQEQYRAHLLSLQVRAQFRATKSATLVIQTYVRQWLALKRARRIWAACKIQTVYRGYRERKSYVSLRDSAVKIQSHVRMVLKRRRYLQLCSATILLQQHIRAHQAMKSQRQRYQCQRRAAICIQAHYRGYVSRLHVRHLKAAIALQATVRMYLARKQYLRQVEAVLNVQRNVRMYLARHEFLRKKAAATLIQNHFRFHLLRRQIETDFQKMKRASHMIQCWYRKVVARNYFLKCKESAVTIQTWWRMIGQRRCYLKQCNSAIAIQRCFKKFQERKKLQLEEEKRTTASCVIQSHWRQYVARRQFIQQRDSVILIQSYVRRHLAKKRSQERLNAVLVLQKYVHAWWLGKCQWEFYHIQRGACIVIQTKYRAWLAERAYCKVKDAAMLIQASMRMVPQRRKYQVLRCATITIQRKWRATLQARKQQREYILQRVAAIILQAVYRGYRCRKAFKMQHRAATVIQSYVRGHQQRQKYQRKRSAVVTIQKCYRNWKIKKCAQEHFLKRRKAAICIQSHVKTFVQRRKYIQYRQSVVKVQSSIRMYQAKKKFEVQKEAVVTLQRRWKSTLLTREVRIEFLTKKESAITLQSHYRALMTRRRFFKMKLGFTRLQAVLRMAKAKREYNKKTVAIRTLQTRARAYLCGKEVRKEFLVKKQAATRLQSHFRAVAAIRRFLIMKKGFIRLQAVVRMSIARRNYKREVDAVKTLQTRVRAYLSGKQDRRAFLKKKQAVVKLQSHCRAMLARRRYLIMKNGFTRLQAVVRMGIAKRNYKQKTSTVKTLQMYVRAYLCGKQVRSDFLVKKQAATKLQSLYRAVLARRRYLIVKKGFTRLQAVVRMANSKRNYSRKISAIRTLQMYVRAYISGKQSRKEFLVKKQAVITLQSHYRSLMVRREYLVMKTGFIQLQAVVRMVSAKKEYKRRMHAVRTLQTYARAYLVGQHVRREFNVKKNTVTEAAVIIQKIYRSYVQRKTYKQTVHRVIKVQSVVRRWLAQRQQKELISQRKAAVCIQAHYRSYRLGVQQRQRYIILKAAALILQTHFRRYSCRQKFLRMSRSAVAIQSAYRMYKARAEYNRTLTTVKTIQTWYRRCRLQKTQRQTFLRTRYAAICIQSAFRGYRCRKYVDNLNSSATKIQAYYRGHIARTQFVKEKSAARTIQAWYRASVAGSRQKQNFTQMKKSVVTVQNCVRRFLAVRRYHRLRHTVVKLQSLIRMHNTQKMAHRKMSAVVTLQRRWRAKQYAELARSSFLVQKQACITLQSTVRMYLIRKRYMLMRSGFIKLQAVVRMRQQQRKYQKQQQAVRIIQSNVRTYCMVQRLKEACKIRKAAVTTIQTHWRAYQSRKRAKQIRAAICIQAVYRSFAERRSFKTKMHLITRLQARVRGYNARRHYGTLQEQNKAAFCIQKCIRRHIKQKRLQKQREIRKVQLEKITTVVRRHLHVVRIQRCVRRYLSMKRAEAQLSSIITIQRWMRSKLERRRFLRMKHSVVTIQRAVRAWRIRNYVEKQKKHATKIQAVWRSYRVRKANKSKKLTAVRHRVQQANAAATEDKKLCNRTSSALDFLLNYKQLAYILEALINLEAVTRLSPECCEQMVEGHALPVIFTLIKSCNRSIPHMELIKYSVAVLLNVAKYEKTAGAVFRVENSIDTLVDVMTHFREKGQVFTKSCTLVGILCYDVGRKKEVRSMTKIVDKIQSIHKIVSRKHNMEEKRQLIKSKMAASQSFCGSLPGLHKSKPQFIRPQWVLRRNSIHVIEDPMKAISFVMNCLNLTSK